MSETATYKQTTFNNVEKDIQQYEQTQAIQPVEQPAQVEAPPITTEVVNTPDITTETQQPAEVVETPQQEDNVVAFDLGQPDTPTTETTVTEEKPTQPTTYNWKEELKKLPRKEVAKELGFNDFSIEMDEYLAKGGRADDYISKRGTDWNKINDEDLVKQDLRNLYPDATQTQIDRLYNKKYTQQEADIDEDREDGLLLMKADARRIREQKIAEQNSFKIPEAIIPQTKDEAYEQWKLEQESQPAAMEQLKNWYNSHEVTKSLNESKKVTISLGDGVAPYNLSIDRPELLTKMFYDGGETWQRLTSTKSGEPDVAKQYILGLVAFNPQQFVQSIFNYGKQMGKKEIVSEGQNAQRPQSKASTQELNQTSYGVGKFGERARN